MHPLYVEFRQYEGASQYISKYDIIRISKQLIKQGKRCKYETKAEIVALVERDYIGLGKEYDMDGILEYINMIDHHQCFDEYFHRKKDLM